VRSLIINKALILKLWLLLRMFPILMWDTKLWLEFFLILQLQSHYFISINKLISFMFYLICRPTIIPSLAYQSKEECLYQQMHLLAALSHYLQITLWRAFFKTRSLLKIIWRRFNWLIKRKAYFKNFLAMWIKNLR